MIRLTHPQHGTKYAYLEEEARLDELNGWTRTPEPEVEARVEVQTGIVDVKEEILADDITTQYIAKFGVPPHHRMKPETILERLKE